MWPEWARLWHPTVQPASPALESVVHPHTNQVWWFLFALYLQSGRVGISSRIHKQVRQKEREIEFETDEIPTTWLPMSTEPRNSTIEAIIIAWRRVSTFDPTEVPNWSMVQDKKLHVSKLRQLFDQSMRAKQKCCSKFFKRREGHAPC